MIKKISLFFSAIAIGILSIFGGISTKNTAEPQYFIKNNVQKQQTITYTEVEKLTINLTNVNSFPQETIQLNFIETSFGISKYYALTEENNLKEIELIDNINIINLYFSKDEKGINENGNGISFYIELGSNIWLCNDIDFIDVSVNKLIFENVKVDKTKLNIINEYIGSYDLEEGIPPLEQINTLVSDIVNWFTNIFNGLGNVFYDPTTNKLTAWGTVMFIGVAIMLISMALKWVISLIRGV